MTLFSCIWHESKPKETAQATPGAAAGVQASGDAEKAQIGKTSTTVAGWLTEAPVEGPVPTEANPKVYIIST